MRSLNEMTEKVTVSLCTNTHDKLLLDWNISKAKFCQQLPISWTESTLQKAPVLITFHVLCPVIYGTHSHSPLEIVVFSYQILCLGLEECCLQVSLGRYRTSSATCHFPRFLKLRGILVCLPHILVKRSQLIFHTPDEVWEIQLARITQMSNTVLFLGLPKHPPVRQVQQRSERWIWQDLASCNCHTLFSIGWYSI